VGAAYHVLTFDTPGGIDARPGQFNMIRGADWGEAPLLPRPMSYLGGGSTPSILIKVIGDGTRRLARTQPGDPFTLVGPLGTSWRAPHDGKHPVLVAGGVGVAPLLFLARALHDAGTRPLVIYGGRTSNDLPLSNDLAQIADLVVTTEDGSRGHQGRVTDVLDTHLTDTSDVFTCGPDRMMAAVAGICATRDIPCEASLETPMACGFGICLGCPVATVDGGYLYACLEGPCMDARRIAWSENSMAPGSTRGAP
jgi:dihydroorotate dehydrogenase electron transfer subunit